MNFQKQYIPWVVAFVLAVSIVGGYRALFAAPTNFSSGSIVRIEQGTPVPEIAQELADAHIIAHPMILRALLRIAGKSDTVQTGVYKFEAPQNVFSIAYRLVRGEYDLPLVRITFVEGVTVREMTTQVALAFGDTFAKDFLSLAQPQEGYLFPDTYFFQPGATSKSIIDTLHANFNKKITPLTSEIGTLGHSISDVVTMASLIEGEASTTVDRHMVSGILWNRIKLGMPLQVDVARDTYTHKGLPLAPINNPGLDSLLAAANPTKTSYLYYLTGHDGRMHYATTYASHQANQKKYLR